MADDDKTKGMLIGGAIVATITVPFWIYDHIRTKNKYYSKGKEDGYAEATVACEIKFRKMADKVLAIKDNYEKRSRAKDELIEKLLKERENLLREKDAEAKKSVGSERYRCLSGAISNIGKTIDRLKVA